MQSLSPGTCLQGSKYKLVSTIGQGFSGFVYQALSSDGYVAIKELFPKGCRRNTVLYLIKRTSVNGTHCIMEWEGLCEAFARECRVLQSIKHPNIVQMIDWFTENNTGYIVLEYLEGSSVDSVAGKEIPQSDAIGIVNQVGQALVYLHGRGFIHRDVKPANIFLCSDKKVRLLDFNISKEFLDLGAKSQAGTPEYWAPEQLRGQQQDQRCDVYGLAAVAYHLLAKQPPPPVFSRLSGKSALVRPRQLNQTISPEVDEAVVSALSLEVSSRTGSIEEFLTQLNGRYVGSTGGGDEIGWGSLLRWLALGAIIAGS